MFNDYSSSYRNKVKIIFFYFNYPYIVTIIVAALPFTFMVAMMK